MNTMAPTRQTELYACRVRLTREPACVAEARRQVRMAIGARHVPVDPDVAVLLTSDLVTSALRHEAGQAVTLAVRCVRGQLRVEVHGTSPGAETGPGMVLVATLSDDWGSYRTPEDNAVYFALAFQPGRGEGGGRGPG